MNAIEQSLRRVLAKGDARDPDHRVRIYEASERAIERLLAEGKIDEAGRDAQHAKLIAAIEAIEAEYPPDASAGAAPAEAASTTTAASEPAAPRGRATPLPAGQAPEADAARPAGTGGAAGTPGGAPERRAPATGSAGSPLPRRAATGAAKPPAGQAPKNRLVYGLVLAAVILFLAAAAYLVLPALFGGGSDPGAVSGDAASIVPSADGWITVFSADRPELVTTPVGGSVEAITGEGERAALRIAVPDEPANGEIVFPVGPGVLSRLGGQSVQVEIEAGSPDGNPREFAVRCAIGEEAVCGRQRFSVAQASEPVLFAMDAPVDAAASAMIAINPGLGGPGQSVDIYAIRMRAG